MNDIGFFEAYFLWRNAMPIDPPISPTPTMATVSHCFMATPLWKRCIVPSHRRIGVGGQRGERDRRRRKLDRTSPRTIA